MSGPRRPVRKSGIARLLAVIRRLRGKRGCPWDREQTLESLKPYLVEECYELIDAIDSGDRERHKEELGDVLLQVALQAQIRHEKGDFSFDDVADQLAVKLIRRHPHVFGKVRVSGSREVLRNWEAIKAREKKATGGSILDGIPRHLPSLQKAQRIQSRASRVGFDWNHVKDVLAKIDEELAEARHAISRGHEKEIREEVGDLLFSVVNLSRFQKIHAEEALAGTVKKFIGRFREVERRVREEGRNLRDCSLAEMDAHWETIKQGEKPPGGRKRRGRAQGATSTRSS